MTLSYQEQIRIDYEQQRVKDNEVEKLKQEIEELRKERDDLKKLLQKKRPAVRYEGCRPYHLGKTVATERLKRLSVIIKTLEWQIAAHHQDTEECHLLEQKIADVFNQLGDELRTVTNDSFKEDVAQSFQRQAVLAKYGRGKAAKTGRKMSKNALKKQDKEAIFLSAKRVLEGDEIMGPVIEWYRKYKQPKDEVS